MSARCRPRLRCIITQEIHCLPHFTHGIGNRLPRFAHDQAEQAFHPRFEQFGGAPFKYFDKGQLAVIGRGQAVVA